MQCQWQTHSPTPRLPDSPLFSPWLIATQKKEVLQVHYHTMIMYDIGYRYSFIGITGIAISVPKSTL